MKAGGSSAVTELQGKANRLYLAGEECVADETQSRHLDAAACFASASLKCAQSAFLMERQHLPDGAQAVLLFAAEMLKQATARALLHSDEYLMAALAHKCASACAMRAFRLRHKDCTKLAGQSRDDLAALEPTAGGLVSMPAASVVRMDKLMQMLQVVCSMVEGFDHSQSLRRALSKDVSEEQRKLLPLLDGASPVALTLQETIALIESLFEAVKARGGIVTEDAAKESVKVETVKVEA